MIFLLADCAEGGAEGAAIARHVPRPLKADDPDTRK